MSRCDAPPPTMGSLRTWEPVGEPQWEMHVYGRGLVISRSSVSKRGPDKVVRAAR